MTPQTLHNLTSPNKEMPGDVFDLLMKSAILEYGSDTDYYFKGKHGNYEILFGTDGETMSVDTFGFKSNHGWIELEPTDKQIDAMKRKIDRVESRPFNTYNYNEANPSYVMWQNGHKPEDFY